MIVADATAKPRGVGRLVHQRAGRQWVEFRCEQHGVLAGDAEYEECPRIAEHRSPHRRVAEFFKDEDEVRTIWSSPDTRKKLLQGLAEKGFGRDQLAEMQKIIDAEKSDLFDVLANVAYAMPPLTREERAARAKVVINTRFNTKQQAFLDFVLSHYVSVGVDELDQEKLTPLLRLKYHNSIADAVADLGRPEEIGEVFSGFQRFLYQKAA